ncbi:MAG: DUF1772 domain-containing protein [Candidatus Thiodiazotropha sp.]|jgi:uncharacterized membrane protein
MGLYDVALILATFLCSLVAGFLFAFAVVVMPGIRTLSDREFIRAFQAMDGIIQNNHPLFMAVWLGSVISLMVAAVFGFGQLDTAGRWLLGLSTLTYLLGVQLPTFSINVPLNNRLQSMDIAAMDTTAHAAARQTFEGRWNRWNAFRTTLSCLVSALLIVSVTRL